MMYTVKDVRNAIIGFEGAQRNAQAYFNLYYKKTRDMADFQRALFWMEAMSLHFKVIKEAGKCH